MKSSIIAAAMAAGMTYACTSDLWGQGTCDYPLVGATGNGPPLTTDIINQLGACFVAKFGPGPYAIDGIDIPDAGGQGNAWGVYTTIDGVSSISIITLLAIMVERRVSTSAKCCGTH